MHGPLGEWRRWYASTNCNTMLETLFVTLCWRHYGRHMWNCSVKESCMLPLIATLCRTDLDNAAVCETWSACYGEYEPECNFVVSKAKLSALKVCSENQASLLQRRKGFCKSCFALCKVSARFGLAAPSCFPQWNGQSRLHWGRSGGGRFSHHHLKMHSGEKSNKKLTLLPSLGR